MGRKGSMTEVAYFLIILLIVVLAVLVSLLMALVYISRREESGAEAQPPVEEPSRFISVGGGGAVGAAGPSPDVGSEDLVGLEGYSRGPREPLGAVKSKLLLTLVRMQSVPFEELQARVQADREVLMDALRELESKGLVRIEGGVVVLSDKGVKLVSTIREKYAEKEAWYENI